MVLDRVLKPGWQTSEFWVVLVAILATLTPLFDHIAGHLVNHYGGRDALLGGAIAVLYAIARSWLKARVADAGRPRAPSVSALEIPTPAELRAGAESRVAGLVLDAGR